MAHDLPESESQTPDGVPLGWEAPWEKPQMMVVEEREGMPNRHVGVERQVSVHARATTSRRVFEIHSKAVHPCQPKKHRGPRLARRYFENRVLSTSCKTLGALVKVLPKEAFDYECLGLGESVVRDLDLLLEKSNRFKPQT